MPAIEPVTAEFSEGVFVGYRGFLERGVEPSYPFGHGLSYTTFAYSRLKVHDPRGRRLVPPREHRRPSRRRSRAGVRRPAAHPVRAHPPKQLAGFARVQLPPRSQRRVKVTIPRRSLSYWDTRSQRWVTPRGRVPVYVGRSSEDTALAGLIRVR